MEHYSRMTNPTNQQTLSLPVNGMSCASCVSHVENALKDLPGVSNLVVNRGTNKASLNYDPTLVEIPDMQRAITDVGYSVPTQEISLQVS